MTDRFAEAREAVASYGDRFDSVLEAICFAIMAAPKPTKAEDKFVIELTETAPEFRPESIAIVLAAVGESYLTDVAHRPVHRLLTSDTAVSL